MNTFGDVFWGLIKREILCKTRIGAVTPMTNLAGGDNNNASASKSNVCPARRYNQAGSHFQKGRVNIISIIGTSIQDSKRGLDQCYHYK
ncbi:MAG: hypothetical protein PHT62_00805 [Desulfotomaculaceae bacterium]|nr:hypothetical protein [Desulfotomaculaceae bacterium]